MSLFPDPTIAGSPTVHEDYPLHRVSSRQAPPQVPGQANRLVTDELNEPSRIPVPLAEQDPLPGRNMAGHPLAIANDHPLSNDSYDCQLEVITAGAVVAIQVQLLTSNSMATATLTRAILSLSMILELLGISLAICFVQARHTRGNDPSRTFSRHALRAPTMLILTGMVGLGVALVLETFETSLGAAVTMIGFLALGVIICLSLLLWGLVGWSGGT